jgi:hypothetical protein
MKTHAALLVAFSFLLLSYGDAVGQHAVRCYTTEAIDQQEKKFPGTKERLQHEDEQAMEWLSLHNASSRSIITIPVVVHVLYHTASENISDEQIFSQIEVLNEDFRRKNADTFNTPSIYQSLGSDGMIEFCLAKKAPDGSDTTGITRTYTSATGFLAGEAKEEKQGWPSGQYLNIWVCHLDSNVLGIATMPGEGGSTHDGVEINYEAFGRKGDLNPKYNFGRTCTHEVGHWLGLTHIWGDDGGNCNGTDHISDTPNQADMHFDCEDFPFISCNNSGDMLMNYMDYTPDACMNIFTKEQVDKMNAVLQTSRSSIQSSPAGCQPVVNNNDASVSKIIFPEDSLSELVFRPKVQITNKGNEPLTSVRIFYRVDGQAADTMDIPCLLETNASEVFELNEYATGDGDHLIFAWSASPNNTADENPLNDTASRVFATFSSIQKNTITAFPVPAGNYFIMTIQNPSAVQGDLRLVNSIGQVAQQYSIDFSLAREFYVDVKNLPNGVYFLYLETGYDHAVKKIMIAK